MSSKNTDSKSVIVTGGASGIGLAIVKYFASQNAKVSIFDISELAARAVVSSLRTEFPSATIDFQKCDVSNWDEQKAAFEQMHKAFGSIDIVIANAGIPEKGNFLSKDEEESKKPNLTTLDVNLSGALYTVKLAVHYMRKNSSALKGSILCTASSAGIYPFPVAPVYATSKHAIVGAVRSLARPLQPEGIQINGLCPVVVETGLADHNLFSAMILTPLSTVVAAVEEFMKKPELSGIVAEISGEKFTFRSPPEYVDESTEKNMETFWMLGYS